MCCEQYDQHDVGLDYILCTSQMVNNCASSQIWVFNWSDCLVLPSNLLSRCWVARVWFRTWCGTWCGTLIACMVVVSNLVWYSDCLYRISFHKTLDHWYSLWQMLCCDEDESIVCYGVRYADGMVRIVCDLWYCSSFVQNCMLFFHCFLHIRV